MGIGLVGVGVIIHETYVVNTVRTLRPEVYEKDTPLQISLIFQRGPFLDFPFLNAQRNLCRFWGHHAHVCRGESLARKVGDPITEIILTRHDEASLIEVEGMVEVK